MKITEEEVRKIAVLARLALSDDETKRLAGEMDSILSYVEKLSELDTDGIAPTAHAVEIVNAFREDAVSSDSDARRAVENAPEKEGDLYLVPRVIE